MRFATTPAFRAAGQHAAFVDTSSLQAVQHGLDGLQKHVVAFPFVGRRPGFDKESAVPRIRGLGVRAVSVDRGMARVVASLVIPDLVFPKPQSEPATRFGRHLPTAMPQHPRAIEFVSIASRLVDPFFRAEIPSSVLAPAQQSGGRTLAVLEAELQ